MFRLPLIRAKPWKKGGLTLENPKDLPVESGNIPRKFESYMRMLYVPGVCSSLSLLLKEYLEESFTRDCKIVTLSICFTNLLFQGTVIGLGMARGVTSSNIFLGSIPLALFGVYSISQESWTHFIFYSLGQIAYGALATNYSMKLYLPPWVMPGYLSVFFLNAVLSLYLLYKISAKERHILRMGHMLNEMQTLKYHPSNFKN